MGPCALWITLTWKLEMLKSPDDFLEQEPTADIFITLSFFFTTYTKFPQDLKTKLEVSPGFISPWVGT